MTTLINKYLRFVPLALVLLAGPARADRYLHFPAGVIAKTPTGHVLDLPPGYYLDDEAHAKVDAELKRLQTAETRLKAEKASLLATAQETPWIRLGVAVLLGVAVGAYVTH